MNNNDAKIKLSYDRPYFDDLSLNINSLDTIDVSNMTLEEALENRNHTYDNYERESKELAHIVAHGGFSVMQFMHVIKTLESFQEPTTDEDVKTENIVRNTLNYFLEIDKKYIDIYSRYMNIKIQKNNFNILNEFCIKQINCDCNQKVKTL